MRIYMYIYIYIYIYNELATEAEVKAIETKVHRRCVYTSIYGLSIYVYVTYMYTYGSLHWSSPLRLRLRQSGDQGA